MREAGLADGASWRASIGHRLRQSAMLGGDLTAAAAAGGVGCVRPGVKWCEVQSELGNARPAAAAGGVASSRRTTMTHACPSVTHQSQTPACISHFSSASLTSFSVVDDSPLSAHKRLIPC